MTLNLGMIATGRIADTALAPAIAQTEGANLWSVYSRSQERADDFAKRHGAAAAQAAHDDLDSMLNDPALDAVVIASPDKLHASQTIACAKAGKHVLVEKPMATTLEDAQAMVAACAEAGVTLGVAYHLRWHAGLRALNQAVRRNEFSEIRHMRIQWSFPQADGSDWRAKDDVARWWSLSAVGTHCIDQLRWFMRPGCGEITTVETLISNAVFGSAHDETALAHYQFESGATAEMCTSVLFEGPTRLEIYGSEGYALCDGALGPHGAGEIKTRNGIFDFTPQNPYVGEITDFAAAVAAGRPAEVSGEEGAENIALLIRTSEGAG